MCPWKAHWPCLRSGPLQDVIRECLQMNQEFNGYANTVVSEATIEN